MNESLNEEQIVVLLREIAVREIRAMLPVLRKPLTDSVKRLHCRITLCRRNGYCPCCQEVGVVGSDGSILPGAEFDHWYARDKAEAEHTWLICGKCNDRLNDPSFKSTKQAEFISYRAALRVVTAGECIAGYQQTLFPVSFTRPIDKIAA